MAFNFKKDWMKLLITLLAVTTAFGFGDAWLSHDWQMYAFSALVLFTLWFKK